MNEQDILKNKVLAQEISIKDFLKEIFQLDQSSLDRQQALKNLEVLTDKDLIKYINTLNDAAQKDYYNILALTEFHVGQLLALENGKDYETLELFKRSLDHEYLGYNDTNIIAYRKATIAYFENKPQEMEEIVKNFQLPEIITKMLDGLKKRGCANYEIDYF